MRIEFIAGQVNTEIVLFENLSDSEVRKDCFYTAANKIMFDDLHERSPFNAEFMFQCCEEVLPPPVIAGEWAAHHPYWAEREAKKKRRQENGQT